MTPSGAILFMNKSIDTANKKEIFLNDIIDIYKKHNLSISHEDIGGGFIIETFKEENVDWLKDATNKIIYNNVFL